MAPALTLYGNAICPYAMRAWMTIEEKAVAYENIKISLGDDKPEWFTKDINPLGTVPAVKCGDDIILESNIITEFLEETYKGVGTQLLPDSPAQRAAIRFFIDRTGSFVTDMNALLFAKDPSKQESAKSEIIADLAFMEGLLARQSKEGPYFLGSNISLADIAIVPFLDRHRILLSTYRQFDLFATAPRLKKLLAAAEQRTSFKKTSLPGEEYVKVYAAYVA